MPRTWKHSREEQARIEKEPLKEIDVGPLFYLVRFLFDLGPTEYVPEVGIVSTSWEKIYSFAKCVDRDWEWWELKVLRLMCIAYTQGYKEGQEPLAVPPSEQQGWTDGKTFQF